ncbi:MAG: SGNH/GDSL hydrolase family protein [Methanotrichaceae archaeon]
MITSGTQGIGVDGKIASSNWDKEEGHMVCTKLGLLLLVSVILSQYNAIGQERSDLLGWQSGNSALNSIGEGKFTLEQGTLGEQLKEQGKWMDLNGALVPIFQDHFILGGADSQNADIFHMVIIGDSIAWGEGLNQDEKYYYLVAKWLQKELNRPIEVTVLAHDGATLAAPAKIDICKHNFLDAELGSWDPTLLEQADHIPNPGDIDLILVSGGINDVEVKTILNPFSYPINKDLNAACAGIQDPMLKVLKELLNNCRNSRIVVTSYYPILSEDTPESALKDVVKKMSLDDPNIIEQFGTDRAVTLDANHIVSMRDNSKKFDDKSRISLSGAVDSANEDSKSIFHEERVIFAPVDFPSCRSYGTGGSWLWKLTDIENGGKTDDHRYIDRTELCDITYRSTCTLEDKIEAINHPDVASPCDMASQCTEQSRTCNWDDKIQAMGHPTTEGAKEYNRSIVEKICDTWPEWMHPTVLAFDVTPLSLASGESFTIRYNVSSSDGSDLKQVELWRKDETSDWQQVKTNTLSDESGPVSGSFTDSPSTPGKHWYGVHVVDNAGNWNDEKNSNTKNHPNSFEPVEVEVKNAQRVSQSSVSNSLSPKELYKLNVVGRWLIHVTAKLPNGQIQSSENGDIEGGAIIFHQDGTFIDLGSYNTACDFWDKSSGTWTQDGDTLRIQSNEGPTMEGTITGNTIELKALNDINGVQLYWSLEKFDCPSESDGSYKSGVCVYDPPYKNAVCDYGPEP